MAGTRKQKTTVGAIHPTALAYTAGRDVELDLTFVEADCLGTAAHVTMLSRMPVKPSVFSAKQAKQVVQELIAIIGMSRAGKFKIRVADQDVHLAVERHLTARLGDLGKKVHTGRSRNDQIALDLRLFAKEELLDLMAEAAEVARVLVALAGRHIAVPMVGRTHMQKAMPSSVGLWAIAHAESLLDDLVLLDTAYKLNDQNPLGSAAGYGVPLPIDRELVTRLLGFRRTIHSVLYAGNARGKNESVILQAAGQVMLSLSRLVQDLMLFTMPEFGYFTLPHAYGTGSSIMPQKNNPDVLELMRARAAKVLGHGSTVASIIKGAPSGYNRDLQEIKEPFLDGLAVTRASLQIIAPILKGMKVNKKSLEAGFTAEVFATDWALELVGGGMSFRDAYHHVKDHLDKLEREDPHQAIARKHHLGATAGLDVEGVRHRVEEIVGFVKVQRRSFYKALSNLLGLRYPKGIDIG